MVERVEVLAEGESEKLHAAIVWVGGQRTEADLVRPVARVDQLSYYPKLAKRLGELVECGMTATQISAALAAEGLRPPRLGERFNPGEIQHLIRRLGLRPGLEAHQHTDRGDFAANEWWLATLAREIGMPVPTLFNWLRRGWIRGRQDATAPYRWIITADPAELERLRALRRLPAGYHNRRRWSQNTPEHYLDHHGGTDS